MQRSKRRGFTLVELLVVIAIIGILIALLLPAVQAAREAARRSQCTNNLKQVGLALQNYHDTYKSFPPEAIYGNGVLSGSKQGPYNYTWLFMILPFIEQQPLYDSADLSYPIWVGPSGSPQAVASTQVGALQCPSAEELQVTDTHNMAYTNYIASEGFHWWKDGWVSTLQDYGGKCAVEGTANFPRQGDLMNVFAQTRTRKMSDIRDGTSNTIVVAEVNSNGYKWGKGWCAVGGGAPRLNTAGERVFRAAFVAVCTGPAPIECNHSAYPWPDPSGGSTWWFPSAPPHASMPTYLAAFGPNNDWPGPSSFHPGGINSVRADGSVDFVSDTIAWHLWMKLNAMADGYPVN
jgi:prepilin-type N-terminal cleavage/methylation domain-containing protein